jgi:hypothetical protein
VGKRQGGIMKDESGELKKGVARIVNRELSLNDL